MRNRFKERLRYPKISKEDSQRFNEDKQVDLESMRRLYKGYNRCLDSLAYLLIDKLHLLKTHSNPKPQYKSSLKKGKTKTVRNC